MLNFAISATQSHYLHLASSCFCGKRNTVLSGRNVHRPQALSVLHQFSSIVLVGPWNSFHENLCRRSWPTARFWSILPLCQKSWSCLTWVYIDLIQESPCPHLIGVDCACRLSAGDYYLADNSMYRIILYEVYPTIIYLFIIQHAMQRIYIFS